MNDELLQAMWEVYRSNRQWHGYPSMRAVLDLLHAHGYRRCAEGQKTTQWCGEVERLREDRDNLISAVETWRAEVERLRNLLSAIRSDAQAAHWHKDIDAARGES